MSQDVLDQALGNVARPLKTLTEKLAGPNGREWLAALKKFLRKENPWELKPIGFSVWRTVTIGHETKKSLLQKLKDGDFYVSDWARDILGKRELTISKSETIFDLVVVSVADLGYKNGATTKEIYDRAKELGLELCPAEVGPQLRLQYIDQPKGEWLRIAMKPIKGSDGDLDIFDVDRNDDGDRFLHADCGRPDSRWNSDSRFVFVKPRK